MEQKKIATSVDVLINVGAYEHIQITKYAEKSISYNSKEEMLQKEDELTNELVADVVRTMRSMPEKLGKKTTANIEIESKIAKKVPEWLNGNVEPNIANQAKTSFNANVAKANANIEAKKEKAAESIKVVEAPKVVETKAEEAPKSTNMSDENLFNDEDLFN